MNKSNNIVTLLVAFSFFVNSIWLVEHPGGNNPGSEYMPDMSHSIAYEANYYDYYSRNTWGSEAEYYKMATTSERLSKEQFLEDLLGAIPTAANDVAIPANGSVPYYYADTEEERTRAMTEIRCKPFPYYCRRFS